MSVEDENDEAVGEVEEALETLLPVGDTTTDPFPTAKTQQFTML